MDSDVTRSTPAPPPLPTADPNAPRLATPHFDRLLALQDAFYAILRALEQVSNDVYQEFPDTDSEPVEVTRLHKAIEETVQEGEALLDRRWFWCTGMGMALDEMLGVPEANEGLPVTLFAEHALPRALQAKLIERGYNPEEDGSVHDDCWPAFKRMLKAKAARPVEESKR
jgi:hypothetical protein